jgi:uncharacterized membrane protein
LAQSASLEPFFKRLLKGCFLIKVYYIMSIVGYIKNSSGVAIPVIWKDALPTTVPTPLNLNGGGGGYAAGINNLGQIVGAINYSIGDYTPVYWENALPTTVPTPLNLNGASGGYAVGINNLGQIVGSIENSSNDRKPVYWENALQTTAPISLNLNGASEGSAYGINNLGKIIGTISNSFRDYMGVYWENYLQTTQPTPLILNGYEGYALGINNLGKIVGSLLNDNSEDRPVYWENYLQTTQPTPLNLNGQSRGYAQGINNLGQIVGFTLDISTDINTPVYWENALPTTQPTLLNLNGASGGVAYGINDPPTPPPTPTPISNICFPAGTPIKTDQGSVNIDLLDKHIHTINKHTILHITRTTTLDKYLIKFEKNALNRNCPSQKTIMTKDHLLEFQGRMVPAYRFLDFSDQVKKVKYNGEVLYNVLLAQHGKMEVNNLVCETLHPDNIIAKLYTGNYMDHERTAIVNKLNNSLQTRDLPGYKDVITNLLTTF